MSVNATQTEYLQGKAYKWLPSSRSAGFVWTTAGDFNLQVSVWDEAWNTDYCPVVLRVRDGQRIKSIRNSCDSKWSKVKDVT
ncbi:MAG: hypothetical protein IPG00_13160 [Saprospiraceae bacterium]|nr:hypothetical protein [Saprospiraceae bacterium]